MRIIETHEHEIESTAVHSNGTLEIIFDNGPVDGVIYINKNRLLAIQKQLDTCQTSRLDRVRLKVDQLILSLEQSRAELKKQPDKAINLAAISSAKTVLQIIDQVEAEDGV